MIETKLFELRDRATFIPAFAFRCRSSEAIEQWLLRKAGYSSLKLPCVILGNLSCPSACACVPYGHRGDTRTYPVAHEYIEKHWDELKSGDVIDVEFILGETIEKKVSEQHDSPH